MDNFLTHEPCGLRLQCERRIEGLAAAHAKELSVQRQKIVKELIPYLMVSYVLASLPCPRWLFCLRICKTLQSQAVVFAVANIFLVIGYEGRKCHKSPST
jgi:hypothetical protein